MDTIFVLDANKNVIDILSNNGIQPSAPFFDDSYTQDLATGAETYEFSTINNWRTSKTLQLGNYVLFLYDDKHKLFQIMETTDEHGEGENTLTCYCETAGLELLTEYCEPFTVEGTVVDFMNAALQDTNWHLGKYSASLLNNIQKVEVKDYTQVYKLIQNNIETFGIEIEFRVEFIQNYVAGFYIDCYAEGERGNKTYKRFEYGKNVKGITRKRDINSFASASIGKGKDNLTFKDVEWSVDRGDPCDKPLGQNFVVDVEANDKYNRYGNYIKDVYTSDTEDALTLLQETWEHLQEVKEPHFDYDVQLGLTNIEYDDLKIGDTNYIVDFMYNPPIMLEARVGKLTLSFSDETKNKCTLSNYKELTSILMTDEELINSIINGFFPIGGNMIQQGAIGEGHINVTYYEAIKTDILTAGLAEVNVLIAGKANITELNALKGTVLQLEANKANIQDLEAANGKITNLQSEFAKIDTLVNGNLSSENMQGVVITADKFTVEDAFIKDAMIDSVSASKLAAGQIDTNEILIHSKDGSMQINGNLQQFKDENDKVRIQIGKDKQGNFTFCLFDKDGKGILIDEKGIKENAIGDGLIVDDMINDNANISGGKLDISSVISEINEDGTTTLKGSKIKLDNEAQTLDVSFAKMKTKTNENTSSISTLTTDLTVANGKIDGLISDSTVVEDGKTVKLKDAYNHLKVTVGGFSDTIGSLTTEINSTVANVSPRYYLSTSNTALQGGQWSLTMPTWTQGKYLWTKNVIQYKDETEEETDPICVTSGDGQDGRSVELVALEYCKSLNKDNPPNENDKGWSENYPVWAKNYYLWVRMKISYSNPESIEYGTPYLDNSWEAITKVDATDKKVTSQIATFENDINGFRETISKVETSTKGTVSKIESLYYLSSSATILEGGNWSTTAPNWVNGKYMWTKTKTYYTDTSKTPTESSPTCIQGAVGATGKGVKSTSLEYLKTSSTGTVTNSTSGWSSTYPSWSKGFYLWVRVKTTYTDNTSTYSTPYKDTSWDSANETDKMQTQVTTQLTQFNTTLGSINSRVEESVATANSAKSIATTAQQTATGFKETITESLNKDYYKKAEINKTVDDLTLSFKTMIANPNLVANGRPTTSNTSYWSRWRVSYYMPKDSNGNLIHDFLGYIVDHEEGGCMSSQNIPVKPNTTYSISFWYRCEKNCIDNRLVIRENDANGNGISWTQCGPKFNKDGDWWIIHNHHTTSANCKTINLEFSGRKNTSTGNYVVCWIDKVMVCKGVNFFPENWYGRNEEIMSSVITLDGNGMKIAHDDGALSHLNSRALEFYNASGNMYSILSGGRLFYTKPNGDLVGLVGRSVWENTTNYVSALYAEHGNSIGLGVRLSPTDTSYNTFLTVHGTNGTYSGWYQYRGVNLDSPNVAGILYFSGNHKVYENYRSRIYNTSSGQLSLQGDNDITIGVLHGDVPKIGIQFKETGSSPHVTGYFGCDVSMNNWTLSNAYVTAPPKTAATSYTARLLAEGSNENITYGMMSYDSDTLVYVCEENMHTTEVYDYDREGNWVAQGRYECYCEIPVFMAENLRNQYHVNISKLSWGDYRIKEKTPYYFIVESEKESFAFTFEVVGRTIEKPDNNASVAAEGVTIIDDTVETPNCTVEME